MDAAEAEIGKVQREIDQVTAEARTAAVQGRDEDARRLYKKEEQLRKKEEQLREKEEQLREKELIALRAAGKQFHLNIEKVASDCKCSANHHLNWLRRKDTWAAAMHAKHSPADTTLAPRDLLLHAMIWTCPDLHLHLTADLLATLRTVHMHATAISGVQLTRRAAFATSGLETDHLSLILLI